MKKTTEINKSRETSKIASMIILLIIAILVAALIYLDGKNDLTTSTPTNIVVQQPSPQKQEVVVANNNEEDVPSEVNEEDTTIPNGGEGDAENFPPVINNESETNEDEDISCVCQGNMAGPGCAEEAPEICTLEYVPVCGCDGITYGNTCGALSASISSWTEGACPGDDIE